jgi:hypothetical protein
MHDILRRAQWKLATCGTIIRRELPSTRSVIKLDCHILSHQRIGFETSHIPSHNIASVKESIFQLNGYGDDDEEWSGDGTEAH